MDIRAHELLFHGPDEWTLRLLSHGRFVSMVPTRSVTESILASQLLSAIRKKQYDIDGTAEAVRRHAFPVDSTQLFQPMLDMMGK